MVFPLQKPIKLFIVLSLISAISAPKMARVMIWAWSWNWWQVLFAAVWMMVLSLFWYLLIYLPLEVEVRGKEMVVRSLGRGIVLPVQEMVSWEQWGGMLVVRYNGGWLIFSSKIKRIDELRQRLSKLNPNLIFKNF
ncbi:hypothetical protein D6821_01360 [Candidatus Parcubacteria bacterium]|nr:MAG: hypothetical protein D6821_01360 [Candidatus Parcubacteria bacterium]